MLRKVRDVEDRVIQLEFDLKRDRERADAAEAELKRRPPQQSGWWGWGALFASRM